MNIKPSAAIRQNYNEIADLCRKTGEPVYLTKNGEGDLVVMDIEAFMRRARDLKIAEDLLRIRTARQCGAQGYTVDEVRAQLEETIANAARDSANGE